MSSSVGLILPNIWKNKIHVANHQPVNIYWGSIGNRRIGDIMEISYGKKSPNAPISVAKTLVSLTLANLAFAGFFGKRRIDIFGGSNPITSYILVSYIWLNLNEPI